MQSETGARAATRASRVVRLDELFRVWFGSHGSCESRKHRAIRYLEQRIDSEAEIERVGSASMNFVCFRYEPEGVPEAEGDQLNRESLVGLQESGISVRSNANHRTRQEDLDLLVEAVLEIG